MTWPLTRLTTYAPLSQIKSADLNAVQDQLIELSSHEYTLDMSKGKDVGAGTTTVNSDDSVTLGPHASGVAWRVPLPPLPANASLTSLIVRASADAAITDGFVLKHEGLDSSSDFVHNVPLQTIADSAVAGISVGTPFALTAGYRYYVELATPSSWGGTAYLVDQVRYTLAWV